MSQIAGLSDLRGQGAPADIGTYQFAATAMVFQFTFSGVSYTVAMASGVSGWVLIAQSAAGADDVEIRAAITYVSALGGGTIIILGGLYICDNELVVLANIWLIGNRDVVLQKVDGFADVRLINLGESSVLYNLVLDGNRANTPASPNGVFLGDYSKILYCELREFVDYTTATDKSDHWVVAHNEIHDITGYAIGSGATLPDYSEYGLIYKNHIYNLTTVSGHGIKLRGCKYVTVSENKITLNDNTTGIRIYNADYSSLYCNITDNVIVDISGTGQNSGIIVDLDDDDLSEGHLIKGNYIENCYYGIACLDSEVTVIENILRISRYAGYYESVATSTDNYVISNRFINDGLSVGGTRTVIQDNYIDDGIQWVNKRGIFIRTSAVDVIIKDNYIINVVYAAIQIEAGAVNTELIQNKFKNCTTRLIDAGTNTIYQSIGGEFTNFGGGSAGEVAPVINTSPGGIDIDANDEFAYVRRTLPATLQQVVRIKIWAYSNVIEATNNMLLRIVAHGAASSELWSGNPIDVVNKPSVEEGGIVQYDVIHWVITATDDAQLGTLAAQDYVELMAVGEPTDGTDIATDALFGGYEIEYV